MASNQHTDSLILRFFPKAVFIIVIFLTSVGLKAQEPPPRPISVTWTNQNLSFGVFYQGLAGGSVTVNPAGARSSTGDVVLLNTGIVSASRYEIVANPGTVISVFGTTSAIFDGSGHSLLLEIPSSVFVTSGGLVTYKDIGGKLTISNPAANPPGNYSGSYDLTFNQE